MNTIRAIINATGRISCGFGKEPIRTTIEPYGRIKVAVTTMKSNDVPVLGRGKLGRLILGRR